MTTLSYKMYDGILALVVQIFGDFYLYNGQYQIFQAFGNDYTLPPNQPYVVMSEMPTTTMNSLPQYDYNISTEIELYNNLDSTSFQVDFYAQNSQENSRLFRAALQSSYATDFLDAGDYNCNVDSVGEITNLSQVLGRDNYILRYAVRFSLFNNNALAVSNLGFSTVNPDLKLIF